MRASGIAALGIPLAVAIGLGGWYYARQIAPAPCGDDAALDAVHTLLHQRDGIDHILFNGVRTLSGGPFSARLDCIAEIAPIRGNVTAATMAWRSVRYSSAKRRAGAPVIDATLETDAPLAAPEPDVWQRLRGVLSFL